MRNLIILGLTIIMTLGASAQSWKFYRNEVYFGVGASNFLGELGGADQIGTNGLKDLEFKMTRPTVTAGYRFIISPHFAVRGALTYGRLNGDDALTNEPYRENRNLHFRSPVVELAASFEYYPFAERNSYAYQMRGVRGNKNHFWSPYIFAGIGGFWFNPKAEYNGDWVALQPLSTEGQGLPGGPEEYKKISLCIPVGGGVKFSLNKEWSLGFEIGMRTTMTDYIDDVSGVYYDNDAIRDAKGDMAADLADPNLGIIPPYTDGAYELDVTGEGMQRGDSSDKDSYMFAILSVHYRLLKGRTRLPKF